VRFINKLIIALLLLNAGIYPAHACMQLYRSLLDGTVIEGFGISDTPQAHFDLDDPNTRKVLQQKLHQAWNIYHKTHSIKDYSDFGAYLAYSGQYQRALKIFQEIEAKKPGLYATAANRGTVEELLGNDKEAYRWIKRGMEINPDSHQGSEWIHLKILEAKVHANGNPDYYRTHDILGLDFGQDKIPVKNTKRDLHQTKKQLYYQLAERMTFVPPKDPIVAQLLFDAGNITAITDDVKTASDVYAQAREYGYSDELIDKREKYFQQLQKIAEDRQHRDIMTPVVGGIAFLLTIIGVSIGGIVLIIKRIKNRTKMKAQ
jgi:tetratricopeptide (TPR) repeat protein